jgi:hypothetical protein
MWEPSHQAATYFNWGKGEPNGYPFERFAIILTMENERKWADLSENFLTFALCQKK